MTAYFLSDLHLGAPYFSDSHEAERRVVRFLDSIKGDADVIYLLGDILDYWYEYRYVVPRGFVRFFGKLAELADSGIRIVWFIGNHDIWIFDYLPSELGIQVIDGTLTEEIDGKCFFMTHGDGVGRQPWKFRFIRSIFRNRICQRMYSAIHPRWTVPFAYGWSRHSRENGGCDGYLPKPENAERMIDNITVFSKEYLKLHPEINYFMYGHLHLLKRFSIAPETEIVVLGEWIRTFSYARWDGTRLEVLKFGEETF